MRLDAPCGLQFCFLSCVLDSERAWLSDPRVRGFGVLSLESDDQMQGAWGRSLAGELRAHKPRDVANKNKSTVDSGTLGLSPGSVSLQGSIPNLCQSLFHRP